MGWYKFLKWEHFIQDIVLMLGWVQIQSQVLSLIFNNILLKKHPTGPQDLWVHQTCRVFLKFPCRWHCKSIRGNTYTKLGALKLAICEGPHWGHHCYHHDHCHLYYSHH